MTTTATHLIVGRPFDDMSDSSAREIAHRFGVEKIEGLTCLYQGDSFVGVEVRVVHGQHDITAVEDLDLTVPEDMRLKAKLLCDALPDNVKAYPGLMPFGAYLVSSDG